MTRQELRAETQKWFCGCGSPELAYSTLLRIFRACPMFKDGGRAAIQTMVPDEGAFNLLLYALDHFGYMEHGTSINCAWLTPKGEAMRDALASEEGDGFEALAEPACIHGFAIDHDEGPHSCAEPNPNPLGHEK